jgi:hypothetical protein
MELIVNNFTFNGLQQTFGMCVDRVYQESINFSVNDGDENGDRHVSEFSHLSRQQIVSFDCNICDAIFCNPQQRPGHFVYMK